MDFGDNPPPEDESLPDMEADVGLGLDLNFHSPLLSQQNGLSLAPQTLVDDIAASKVNQQELDLRTLVDAYKQADGTSSTQSDTMSMLSLGTDAQLSSTAAEKRIRFLSKKARELTAVSNAEKAKNNQLTKKVS